MFCEVFWERPPFLEKYLYSNVCDIEMEKLRLFFIVDLYLIRKVEQNLNDINYLQV